jgi:cytochrome c
MHALCAVFASLLPGATLAGILHPAVHMENDTMMIAPGAAFARACCLLLFLAVALQARAAASGDPARGKIAIGRYGCVACHTIPGIPNPGSDIAPSLEHFARHSYIAGVLPNQPEDMQRWLRNPPAVDPRTAMPDMGVSAEDARDMAAYLYTLK